MQYMIIMRGVSGSGKSTWANRFMKKIEGAAGIAVKCSADDYFIKEAGAYKFDPALLPAAHAYCFGKAEGAAESEANIIIIDNTNLRKWESKAYISLAKKHGMRVKEHICGALDEDSLKLYASRNSHGVGIETIKKMAAKFEK